MRAVIVAKTRMGQNICVGAVSEHTGVLHRLIPRVGQQYHSWQSFDAPIGALVQVEGDPIVNLDPPHVEDYLVARWRQVDVVEDMNEWICQICDVSNGLPDNLFDGLLQSTESGSRFIQRSTGVPAHSVGFWRLPWSLYHREWRDDQRVTHSYASAQRYGFKVKYVGVEVPVEDLARGTVVRVSLARWHRFQGEDEERCWLQLSGWYRDDEDLDF